MKYITRFVFTLMVAAAPLLPIAALAHSNHHEPMSETQLLGRAESHVRNIADDPDYFPELKLDADWSGQLTSRVAEKSARALILAVNSQQSNKTIYLYMDYYGGLYSANFSGDFEGWK